MCCGSGGSHYRLCQNKKNMRKKTFTIIKKFYDNRNIELYDNREEWIEAIDDYMFDGGSAGAGESFEVCIYEGEIEKDNWEGVVWHSASRDRYANIDSIPEEYEPLECYTFYFCNIIEKNNGKWVDEDGEEYDTEEEAREVNSVANSL